MNRQQLDQRSINTIRFLSVDMVQQANSGHPGLPLAIRLSALAQLRSILVFTHDSIGVLEDGPTHQSVEHVAALRAIPTLLGWERWTGLQGAMIGLDHFGASAPGPTLFENFGFRVQHVVERALAIASTK